MRLLVKLMWAVYGVCAGNINDLMILTTVVNRKTPWCMTVSTSCSLFTKYLKFKKNQESHDALTLMTQNTVDCVLVFNNNKMRTKCPSIFRLNQRFMYRLKPCETVLIIDNELVWNLGQTSSYDICNMHVSWVTNNKTNLIILSCDSRYTV